MTLATSVLGYAGIGFLTRCYALDLGGHAMAMGAFGGIGYFFYGIEGRQNELIAKKKDQILQNRERLTAQRQGNGNGNGGNNEE